VEPDEITIAPTGDAAAFGAAATPDQNWAPAGATPAVRADADSIAALESELGAIEAELHALDHDAH
jgi:hypothetical protein